MGHLPLLLADAKAPRIIAARAAGETPQDDTDSMTRSRTHAALAKLTPSTDWTAIDRMMGLQRVSRRKAIAWVLADRIGEDRSATLARLEDEIDVRFA